MLRPALDLGLVAAMDVLAVVEVPAATAYSPVEGLGSAEQRAPVREGVEGVATVFPP